MAEPKRPTHLAAAKLAHKVEQRAEAALGQLHRPLLTEVQVPESGAPACAGQGGGCVAVAAAAGAGEG